MDTNGELKVGTGEIILTSAGRFKIGKDGVPERLIEPKIGPLGGILKTWTEIEPNKKVFVCFVKEKEDNRVLPDFNDAVRYMCKGFETDIPFLKEGNHE